MVFLPSFELSIYWQHSSKLWAMFFGIVIGYQSARNSSVSIDEFGWFPYNVECLTNKIKTTRNTQNVATRMSCVLSRFISATEKRIYLLFAHLLTTYSISPMNVNVRNSLRRNVFNSFDLYALFFFWSQV